MRISFAALMFLLVSHAAWAGAWTQPQGKGQLILNNWYYQADERFTNTGSDVSQPTYRKYELNPYMEYGIADGITLGTNLSLQRTSQSSNTNWGIGDSEFFARFRLLQQHGWAVAAEPMVKLPSPHASRDEVPVIGGDASDVGMTLSAGYGFEAYGKQHFITADAGYRHRFGTPEDQMRYSLTAGFSLAPKWQLMPQVFVTQRTNSPAVATFTQSTGDDYNLVKLQLSAVYHYNDEWALQAGTFSHVDGKNSGAGEGVLFAIWKNF